MQHYFSNELLKAGDHLELPKEVSHHLSRVLRAEVGDDIELVSVDHVVYEARINEIVDQKVSVIIVNKLSVNVELPIAATIVSGLSKRNKPELIVQKATELGASQVIFVPMDWSIVKWDQKSAKKIKRLNEVALSAAEQSHRNVIPRVRYLHNLADLVTEDFDAKIVAYEESAKSGEEANLVKKIGSLQSGASVVAVFGPEGGVSPAEIQMLVQNGYTTAGLGPRIMRTETAPLYFLSACSVLTELTR
ncbi:16S rRNA (uracil(1498)-N(3))-methyltransferase [Lentilactobacillus kisonensis]|nr:16S rRNA (uracil(1498)-N(3))-methyltransferase [Lentilactobacillus kisonensis]KRL23329.1 RNA methyltransferase, RsmE family [Lentilactobacillus kisonensis DSM 19906 = JCM 15041]